MVERYRIFAFTTFYRADSLPGMRPVNPVSDLETRHLHIPRQEAALPMISPSRGSIRSVVNSRTSSNLARASAQNRFANPVGCLRPVHLAVQFAV